MSLPERMSAKFSGLVLKTLPQAAATSVYAALSPDLLNQSGKLLPLSLLPYCASNQCCLPHPTPPCPTPSPPRPPSLSFLIPCRFPQRKMNAPNMWKPGTHGWGRGPWGWAGTTGYSKPKVHSVQQCDWYAWHGNTSLSFAIGRCSLFILLFTWVFEWLFDLHIWVAVHQVWH